MNLSQTYLQGRTHVLAGTDARTCKDGCSALQGRMQCTAEAVAVHCRSGCSALRLRWVTLAPKLPVLFYKVCQTTKHKNRHFMA